MTDIVEDDANNLPHYVEVRKMIAQLLLASEAEVEDSQSFVDDLEADSLALLELQARIEKRYGIEIPEEELANMMTMRSAYEVIAAAAGWRDGP